MEIGILNKNHKISNIYLILGEPLKKPESVQFEVELAKLQHCGKFVSTNQQFLGDVPSVASVRLRPLFQRHQHHGYSNAQGHLSGTEPSCDENPNPEVVPKLQTRSKVQC